MRGNLCSFAFRERDFILLNASHGISHDAKSQATNMCVRAKKKKKKKKHFIKAFCIRKTIFFFLILEKFMLKINKKLTHGKTGVGIVYVE